MARPLPWLVIACLAGLAACGGTPPPADPYPLTPIRGHLNHLKDGYGRYVFLNGIEVSGAAKVPARIDANGVPSYVDKPFPLDQADYHFGVLQEMGFNSIRLMILWEGLQPTGPDTVDRAYVDYLHEIVKAAGRHGIRVLLEMHQDDFSRFLLAHYNQHPTFGTSGSLENVLTALLPPYDDVVAGNGAPRWVVEAALPERDLSSPGWGVPRLVSGLKDGDLDAFVDAARTLIGSTDGPVSDAFVRYFREHLPGPFPVRGTSDFLPTSSWGLSAILSIDAARCYGSFFAGRTLFPTLEKDGKNVQDYLQDAFTLAWVELAKVMADEPNIAGYDVFNEPNSNFVVLTAVAAAVKAGAIDGAKGALQGILGRENGAKVFDVLVGFRILPPDTKPETLAEWGLDRLDVGAALATNVDFDEKWMRPFWEKVGGAIQAVDPDAVIWIEPSINLNFTFGPGGLTGGLWQSAMRPPELPYPDQVVWAPHWYPDMYPWVSFVRTPRNFTPEEVRYRDYLPGIAQVLAFAPHSLGNMPAVFGEFGLFFDFNGIEKARAEDYIVTTVMLNNYFEALERLNVSRLMWNYNPENRWEWGDLWNHEDLSIIDPDGKWRGEDGWLRPHPNALAGRPVSMRYFSDVHYFDPAKGEVNPVGEFELRYAAKETSAPTEIQVPARQYPDGFLVWLSDGRCTYDAATQTLFHFPDDDAPGAEHVVTVRRPLPGAVAEGWRCLVQGGRVVTR